MIDSFSKAYRSGRGFALLAIYSVVAAASLYVAYEIRFDFAVPPKHQQERIEVVWLVIGVKLVALFLARQMGSMVTFFGLADFFRLSAALLASVGVLLAFRFFGYGHFSPPRGVLLVDFLLCMAAFCGFRISARLFRERVLINPRMRGRAFERVVIIGAGDTGASLVNDLIGTPARGLRPVAILDDDESKHGRFIHGVRIEGVPEDFAKLASLEGVRHAIVAMPSAPIKRVAEIALFLGRLGVQVETVPAIEDLASGRARVSRIRPLEIQDLLGRSPVDLDTSGIRHFVEQKVVMVTGAGGSIGSELCRQIAGLNPRRLLLVDQSEPSLFVIEQELIKAGYSGTILPCVADILDAARITALFATHAPQVVFHAAAHKHVFLMERQPAEAVKNNSIGSRKLAEIAVEHGAEAFVFISTDKAINPTNAMGASKRLAEIHLQAIYAAQLLGNPAPEAVQSSAETMRVHGAEGRDYGQSYGTVGMGPYLVGKAGADPKRSKTKIMAVRFGNVLGSSGSVLPIFKKQIEEGGPVTVTHPDVTRYFMTIPEAVGLVLQASVMGKGGEIFVLDMGKPVKIHDLAKNMIELSGYNPGEDIEIQFTGLKPGEKLYEELQHHSEQHTPTDHPRIMRFSSSGDAVKVSHLAKADLEPFVDELSPNDLKRNLKILIPEYEPCFD
jgi:FlaA1/EpsC-like NDP-sugar epimerase